MPKFNHKTPIIEPIRVCVCVCRVPGHSLHRQYVNNACMGTILTKKKVAEKFALLHAGLA